MQLVKFLGDGFFAICEYNDESKDSLFRSVKITLDTMREFHKSVMENIKSSHLHEKTDLGVGYGMTYGKGMAKFLVEGKPDYIGNEINIASRLCSVADKGTLIAEKSLKDTLEELKYHFKEEKKQIKDINDVTCVVSFQE